MEIAGGAAAAVDVETRVLGKLSLAPNERATVVLVAQLRQKEILYSKNVANAPHVAELALKIYTATIDLGSGLPFLVRMEGSNDDAQHHWRAIYTGKFFNMIEIQDSFFHMSGSSINIYPYLLFGKDLWDHITDGTYLFYAEIERDA